MKLTGCIFIMAGFFWLGRVQAKKYARQLYLLESWYQKLLFLQGEIKYAKTPLPEAFLYLGKEGKEENAVSAFFQQVGFRLINGKGQEKLEKIWKEEVEKLVKEIPIEYESTCLLGEGMGTVDRITQVEHIERYLSILKRLLEERQGALMQQQKVVQTVMMSVGALVVMVLI